MNIKIKNSITHKLFIITSLVLTAFLLFSLIFQSMFFSSFYLKKKMSSLKEDVLKFKLNYSYNINDNTSLYENMQDFENHNNAKIAIISSSGEIIYLSNPKKQIDENFKTTLNDILKTISSEGIYRDIISGSKNNVTELISCSGLSSKNIVSVSSVSINKENDSLIIAFSPFQPIEEANSVIKDFFIYMAFFAFIAIIILSIIYTKIISKPLTKINNTALKMSRLDFTEKCPVESEDEIGNLAKTLNFLSLNLNNALQNLKIANENLKKDIEKKKQLESLRKEFIANVSHELKTPIALIEGYAEGIKDGITDEEETKEYLDVIIDESKKMNTLVMSMLELYKLESPNLVLDISAFSIYELIKKCCRPLQQFVSSKHITLTINVEDLQVLGDVFKISEVITNLLTNAIEHCIENGSINISSIDCGSSLQINISNTGKNIPVEEMENIWDKFYKLDKARTRILGGTGLGLAIVKNILELHKSKFGIKNLKDGVCFFFTIKKA